MKLHSRSGMTLVEIMISMAIFATTMLAFGASLKATKDTQDLVVIQDRLNRSGLKALKALRQELMRSGFENGYPQIFDGNQIGNDYGNLAHDVPLDSNGAAVAACDIVFRQPADADDNGWPDTLDGSPVWEANPCAFTVMPDTDGWNRLVRTDVDGNTRIVSRDLESLTFEPPSATGFAIPMNSMRVTLVLRAPGPSGQDVTQTFSMVVALQNGGNEV